MSYKALLLGSALALCSATSFAASYTPPTLSGSNNNLPEFTITFNANGSIVTTQQGGPYITEDAYLAIVNNTGHAITSLNLSSTTNIFGFDSDGIDTFGVGTNAQDNTGYGGTDAYFTNINGPATSGTVNFIGGINANGGTGYFSLEEALTLNQVASIVNAPEPMSMAILGAGLAGLSVVRRRRAV